jgi:GTP pyrophosphokinase
MQAASKTIAHFTQAARHFYDRGFSILALFMMLLAFACSGLIQAKNETENSEFPNAKTIAALPAMAQADVWHEAQANWLSQKATDITKDLKTQGIQQVTVYSRVKSYESASEKAVRKRMAIHELNDLLGMRIVVGNELDVYRCLNRICEQYEPVPGTLKNYIITPKASGYQSVHVVTQVDDIHRIEFQIRTESMHNQAEAEHEAYKSRVRAA